MSGSRCDFLGSVSMLLVSDLVESRKEGERHCISAVAFMVAGGGFEPPTFGLCDLTHLSMRVGLYLHPEGCSPSSLYAFPHHSGGLVRYCPIARAT